VARIVILSTTSWSLGTTPRLDGLHRVRQALPTSTVILYQSLACWDIPDKSTTNLNILCNGAWSFLFIFWTKCYVKHPLIFFSLSKLLFIVNTMEHYFVTQNSSTVYKQHRSILIYHFLLAMFDITVGCTCTTLFCCQTGQCLSTLALEYLLMRSLKTEF